LVRNAPAGLPEITALSKDIWLDGLGPEKVHCYGEDRGQSPRKLSADPPLSIHSGD
jgi:hypothetical protein